MKIKHSIFLKLLSIIIITGILITILLIVFFWIHFSPKIREQFSKNYTNYYSYLAAEIGVPPDTLLAKKIAKEYSLAISFRSGSINWKTESNSVNRHRFLKYFSWLVNKNHIIKNKDGSRFIFSSDFHGSLKPQLAEFILLFSALFVILALSYLLIKRMLKPIKDLSKGVTEVSRGNFSHQISVYSTDEFASLSDSFNKMTGRIKEMINSRDQLLLDVSHELRTPLTRIKLALEMIAADKNKESIAADVKEIEIMITEILESERLKKGGLSITENDIVRLMKEVVSQIPDKGPGIVFKNIPEIKVFNFDYERIRIVLRNILENSVKYSHTESKAIILELEDSDSTIIIKVIDDGIGIPSGDVAYVFEPFYRSDRSRSRKTGGFGLGLAISRQIVEAHGGNIEIGNNVDRGTTLTIMLPKTAGRIS